MCVKDTGTKYQLWISDFNIDGTFTRVHPFIISHTKTMTRTREDGKEEVFSACIKHDDTRYLGGNKSSSIPAGMLQDRPRTGISYEKANEFCANRGDWITMIDYLEYCAIQALCYIEYANFDNQDALNTNLTSDGFKQGGLGAGVTNLDWDRWTAFNGNNPIVQTYWTAEHNIGNGSTNGDFYTLGNYNADGSNFDTYPAVYRGILNFFGDKICKEELKCKFYYRYADDIVILSNDKDFLHKVLIYIKLYVNTIGLKVKDNYQIYPVDSRGINFVGYVFYHTHILIRKSIKYKIIRLVNSYLNREIDKKEFKVRMCAYYGWLKHADAKNLLYKIQSLTGVRYSNWNGKRTNIAKYYGKYVRIIQVINYAKYFRINFIRNGKAYYADSRDKTLFYSIHRLNHFPINFKITKYDWRIYVKNRKENVKPQT